MTTTTGSPALWTLAEAFDLIPAPPNGEVAELLAGWWALPRVFGCSTARTSPTWVVVAPSPAVWCRGCALEAYAIERRCAVCHRPVRLRRAVALHFEMRSVLVLGRAHQHCLGHSRPTSSTRHTRGNGG